MMQYISEYNKFYVIIYSMRNVDKIVDYIMLTNLKVCVFWNTKSLSRWSCWYL